MGIVSSSIHGTLQILSNTTFCHAYITLLNSPPPSRTPLTDSAITVLTNLCKNESYRSVVAKYGFLIPIFKNIFEVEDRVSRKQRQAFLKVVVLFLEENELFLSVLPCEL